METKDKVIMFAMLLVILVLAGVLIVKRRCLFPVVDHFAEEEEEFTDDEPFVDTPTKAAATPSKTSSEAKVQTKDVKKEDEAADHSGHETSTTKKAVQTLQSALNALSQKLEYTNISPEDKSKLLKELFTESNLSTMLTSGAVSLPSTVNKVVSSVVGSMKPVHDTFVDTPDIKPSLDAIKKHIQAAMDEIDSLASKSDKKATIAKESFLNKKDEPSSRSATETLSIEGFENVPKYALF